jgi:hypothetical protein
LNDTGDYELVKIFREKNLALISDLSGVVGNARLKLFGGYRILGAFRVLREGVHRVIKEEAMRKVLLLVLVSMFFAAAACSKSEETAPAAPEASASAASEASPAAPASPAEMASPAASPAAP